MPPTQCPRRESNPDVPFRESKEIHQVHQSVPGGEGRRRDDRRLPEAQGVGVPDATVTALVGHETLAMSSPYTHVGKKSLESAVPSLPSFGLVPEVATPASKDEVEDDNENSATLKPA